MSLINIAIPKQGFEKVRDVIASIIKTELDEQKTLQNLVEDINVYLGRISPFQHSEKLMINILYDGSNYNSFSEAAVQGVSNFFIDVYVSAKEKSTLDGGQASTILRDKYVGMIRYILEDHHYKTLGLQLGLIMGTSVDSIENFESINQQDTAFTKFGRISFAVRLIEDQSLWDGIDINTIFTEVKLDLTTKGYQYVTE